jgi:hypothetical protein
MHYQCGINLNLSFRFIFGHHLVQPGVGADLGDETQVLLGAGMGRERFLQLVAGEIEALVAEFHAFVLGAEPDLAAGAPNIIGIPFAPEAFDLLRGYRFAFAIEIFGNALLGGGIIGRISDINLAIAAENPTPSQQGSVHNKDLRLVYIDIYKQQPAPAKRSNKSIKSSSELSIRVARCGKSGRPAAYFFSSIKVSVENPYFLKRAMAASLAGFIQP